MKELLSSHRRCGILIAGSTLIPLAVGVGRPGPVPIRAHCGRRLTHGHPPSLRPREVPRALPSTSWADETRRDAPPSIQGRAMRLALGNRIADDGRQISPARGSGQDRPAWRGRGRPSRRPAHLSVARHQLRDRNADSMMGSSPGRGTDPAVTPPSMKELLSSHRRCGILAAGSTLIPLAVGVGRPGPVPIRAHCGRQLTHGHPPSLRPREAPRACLRRAGPTRREGTLHHLFRVEPCGSPSATGLRTTGARFHPLGGPARTGPLGRGRGRLSRRPAHLSVARHQLRDRKLRSHSMMGSSPGRGRDPAVTPPRQAARGTPGRCAAAPPAPPAADAPPPRSPAGCPAAASTPRRPPASTPSAAPPARPPPPGPSAAAASPAW